MSLNKYRCSIIMYATWVEHEGTRSQKWILGSHKLSQPWHRSAFKLYESTKNSDLTNKWEDERKVAPILAIGSVETI